MNDDFQFSALSEYIHEYTVYMHALDFWHIWHRPCTFQVCSMGFKTLSYESCYFFAENF